MRFLRITLSCFLALVCPVGDARAEEPPWVQLQSIRRIPEGVLFTAETPRTEIPVASVDYDLEAQWVVGTVPYAGRGSGFKGRSTNSTAQFSLVWTNATPSWYTVRARAYDIINSYLGQTTPMTLYVFPSGDVFGQHEDIADQVVTTNSTVQFKVVAFTDTPVRYQWNFNGQDLNGEISETLTLTNVQRTDEGFYSCRIDTSFATVPSATAHLSVNVEEPGYLHFENVANLDNTNGIDRAIDYSVITAGWDWDTTETPLIRSVELWAGKSLEHLSQIGARVLLFKWVTNGWATERRGYFDGGIRAVPAASVGERVYVQVVVKDPRGLHETRFSNCRQVVLGTSNAPARLVPLAFPWHLEWPHPHPSPYRYLLFAEPGSDHLFEGGGWNYSEFQSEWRKNGLDLYRTQQEVVFFECASSVPCMSARIYLPLSRVQTRDVGCYQLYEGYDFNHMISAPVRLVVMKSRAGRFLQAAVDESESGWGILTFQGQGGIRYQLEASSDLTQWHPLAVSAAADGLLQFRVRLQPPGLVAYRTLLVDAP